MDVSADGQTILVNGGPPDGVSGYFLTDSGPIFLQFPPIPPPFPLCQCGDPAEAMTPDASVVVGTFPNRETAEAIVSLLASEGVDAVLQSDDAGGELPNLDLGRGIRVYVQEEDAEFAKGLLDVDSVSDQN